MYQFTLEKFSGPLDLLLSLVEEEKLSINEISLSKVAEEYIAYLKSLEEMPKDELAAFLVIASTLMLIKSRSLIPNLKLSDEEEIDIKDLERRLKTYKFFKKLGETLRGINKQGRHLFGREAYAGMQAVFFPPHDLTKETLSKIVVELLTAIPQKESLPEDTLKKAVSLEEKMGELKGRLEKMINVNFSALGGSAFGGEGGKDKIEIIVGFLAVLELVRQGFAIFEQKGIFANIEVKKNG
ncbi:MAG: segregation/condensation protein A [bacterium]|nr:segregation/condensation protein A [bacterium]